MRWVVYVIKVVLEKLWYLDLNPGFITMAWCTSRWAGPGRMVAYPSINLPIVSDMHHLSEHELHLRHPLSSYLPFWSVIYHWWGFAKLSTIDPAGCAARSKCGAMRLSQHEL